MNYTAKSNVSILLAAGFKLIYFRKMVLMRFIEYGKQLYVHMEKLI